MEFLSSFVIPILIQLPQINVNILSWWISQLLLTPCSPTQGALWLQDTRCSAQRLRQPKATQAEVTQAPPLAPWRHLPLLWLFISCWSNSPREKLYGSKMFLELTAHTDTQVVKKCVWHTQVGKLGWKNCFYPLCHTWDQPRHNIAVTTNTLHILHLSHYCPIKDHTNGWSSDLFFFNLGLPIGVLKNN